MPAISFAARHIDPIRSMRKRRTIRAREPVGFKLGHWAPLYAGLRTRHATLIGSGLMCRSAAILIDFDAGLVETPALAYPITHHCDLDEFAWLDGFDDWSDMEAFWDAMHPGERQFTGVILGWTQFVLDRRLGAQEAA